MTEKTLPEQARFLAKFIEENNYNEWPEDWEIAQMLEDLAGEIDRLQSELCTANKDFAEMSRTYVEVRNERDRARAERDELLTALSPMVSGWKPGRTKFIDPQIMDHATALIAKLEGRNDD